MNSEGGLCKKDRERTLIRGCRLKENILVLHQKVDKWKCMTPKPILFRIHTWLPLWKTTFPRPLCIRMWAGGSVLTNGVWAEGSAQPKVLLRLMSSPVPSPSHWPVWAALHWGHHPGDGRTMRWRMPRTPGSIFPVQHGHVQLLFDRKVTSMQLRLLLLWVLSSGWTGI